MVSGNFVVHIELYVAAGNFLVHPFLWHYVAVLRKPAWEFLQVWVKAALCERSIKLALYGLCHLIDTMHN